MTQEVRVLKPPPPPAAPAYPNNGQDRMRFAMLSLDFWIVELLQMAIGYIMIFVIFDDFSEYKD